MFITRTRAPTPIIIIAALVGLMCACTSGSQAENDTSGKLALDSQGVEATWCLPVDTNTTNVDFSHGTEVLRNDGNTEAEIVDITSIDANDIEVEDFWFADVTRYVVGTLKGWPPTTGGKLQAPYPLASGDTTNLVAHLVAPAINLQEPPQAAGLRITYRQDGAEHEVETHVGVQCRARTGSTSWTGSWSSRGARSSTPGPWTRAAPTAEHPGRMAGMTNRALSFGSGAADYERHRAGYPDALVAEVLAYAGRPVRMALEIGAGTGKATRAFAAAGVDVLATDPDAGMLAELRQQIRGARTLLAGFEDLDGAGTYDLVFAAAAMHWTDPVGRWAKVARLLEPSGAFASFGGPIELADTELALALHTARAPFLADDGVASPDGTPAGATMQWPGSELVSAPEFTDVRQVVLERSLVMSTADYLGHLSTISAYRVLPEDVRAQAFEAVRDVLPAEVHLTADLVLHLARRVST